MRSARHGRRSPLKLLAANERELIGSIGAGFDLGAFHGAAGSAPAARDLLTSEGWQRWIRVRATNGLTRYSLLILSRPRR